MSEQTETERAIEYFEKKMSEAEYEIDLGFADLEDKHAFVFFDTAISALKQQSEAERRIGRATTECKDNIYRFSECLNEGFSQSACAVLKDAKESCKRILEILEGN